jgi:hypothetical protein
MEPQSDRPLGRKRLVDVARDLRDELLLAREGRSSRSRRQSSTTRRRRRDRPGNRAGRPRSGARCRRSADSCRSRRRAVLAASPRRCRKQETSRSGRPEVRGGIAERPAAASPATTVPSTSAAGRGAVPRPRPRLRRAARESRSTRRRHELDPLDVEARAARACRGRPGAAAEAEVLPGDHELCPSGRSSSSRTADGSVPPAPVVNSTTSVSPRPLSSQLRAAARASSAVDLVAEHDSRVRPER